MKAVIIALTSLSIIGSSLQTASAHDQGWCTAGKILTGIAAGTIIAQALQPAPVVAAPVYAPPPVVVAPVAQTPYYGQPAPVVVYSQPVIQPPLLVAPTLVAYPYRYPGYYYRPRYRICW